MIDCVCWRCEHQMSVPDSLGGTSRNCPRCGAEVPVPAQQARVQEPSFHPPSAKSWLVTLLLAAYPGTGMLGVHRFYVGKIRSGLLMGSFMMVFGGAILLVLLLATTLLASSGASPETTVEGAGLATDAALSSFLNKYGFSIVPFCLAQLIWWIVDVVRIARGRFTDAAGRPVTRRTVQA